MSEAAAESLKKFVRRRAGEVLGLPIDQREAALARVHEAGVRVAIQYGWSELEAQIWAQRIVEFTRRMVILIEAAEQSGTASASPVAFTQGAGDRA